MSWIGRPLYILLTVLITRYPHVNNVSVTMYDATLPDFQLQLIAAMANEGIPLAACARVLSLPFSDIEEAVKDAILTGTVAAMPRADWPPDSKTSERAPTVGRMTPEGLQTALGTCFQLTRLEAGFLSALMRCETADKDKLHGVVEQQRNVRHSRPDNPEPTDPRMVDVMICKLRKKMTKHGLEIKTAWGRGYYLEPAVKKAIYDCVGSAGGTSNA